MAPRRTNSCYCAIRTCKNNGGNYQKSFFRFPGDFTRARKWAILCNRHDLLENENLRNRRLCEDHFEREMFVNCSRKKLIRNAYPSLLMDNSSQTAENKTNDHDDQMEPTENTKTQIMLGTIETLDVDEAEKDSSENIIEEVAEYERNTGEDVNKYSKTEIQQDPLEIKDEESDDTSMSTRETEVQRGEKGHGVKRKREEDDDIELLGLKTNDVEVGLPLKDCCAHHQDRIKQLEHQLELCHEIINTFIKKTEVELEVKKIDRSEDQSSQKRWKNEIDLLKKQNNQQMCKIKFMETKEENFQSRLDHLLHLLNAEKDKRDKSKTKRIREKYRWNGDRYRLEKTIEETEKKLTAIEKRETQLNVSLKKKEVMCVNLLKEIDSLNEELQKGKPCKYCGL